VPGMAKAIPGIFRQLYSSQTQLFIGGNKTRCINTLEIARFVGHRFMRHKFGLANAHQLHITLVHVLRLYIHISRASIGLSWL